jgi:hypothetical protein
MGIWFREYWDMVVKGGFNCASALFRKAEEFTQKYNLKFFNGGHILTRRIKINGKANNPGI